MRNARLRSWATGSNCPDTTPNGLTQTFSLLTEDGGNYLGTQTIPLDSTRRGGVLFQGTLVNTFDLATLAAGLNFEGTSLFTTGDGSLTVTVRFVLWPL